MVEELKHERVRKNMLAIINLLSHNIYTDADMSIILFIKDLRGRIEMRSWHMKLL